MDVQARRSAGRGSGRSLGILAWAWLVYLGFPMWSLLTEPFSPLRVALGLSALAAYVGLYLWYWKNPLNRPLWHLVLFVGGTLAMGLILGVDLKQPYEASLAVYAAPALALAGSDLVFYVGMAIVLAIVLAVDLAAGGGAGLLLSTLVPQLPVALGTRAIRRFMAVQSRLSLAEEEIQSLAAANERLRIGRDLHDVLGHTLSAMAFRADLAAVQADGVAKDSAAEMRRVAQMAREALTDVRAVVTGYRQMDLVSEWATGRQLLESSGVSCEGDHLPVDLPAHVDRTFAFVLRETLTNILRHSRASRCHVAFESLNEGWTMTVSDDGKGAAGSGQGNGLKGLKDRAEAAGGQLLVTSEPGRGFTVEVHLPLNSRRVEVS